MKIYDVRGFGAVGDGKTLDTEAIQQAIDTCAGDGGGRVVLSGPFVYRANTLFLKSNVEFRVETETVLKCGDDRFAFPHDCFLYAENQENIVLSGDGVIDGNYEAFLDVVSQYHKAGYQDRRPRLMILDQCRHISIRDLTMRGSTNWTCHMSGCDDISISNLRILNDLAQANSDGIDLDHCRNARITNCYISCADDCIVFKNTRAHKEYGPCENITVTNCTLTSTSAAVKFGSESVSDFRNIIVSNCIITDTNRALGLQLRDEGNIENVLFDNIIIHTRRFYDRYWGKAEPIYVTSLARAPEKPSGYIRNVRFRNIIAHCENGALIEGSFAGQVSGISLEDVKLVIGKHSKWEGGIYDRRPTYENDMIHDRTNGVRIVCADDISLRGVQIEWEPEAVQEYYGEALYAKNVRDLELDRFRGSGAHPGQSAVLLEDTTVLGKE
ncbi:MAG TPA: right-handed parallel beta-helix repeat-containing protein [Candidatus Gallacutalibacter pullicola]|uniref:Right-handed parallel beta-helix repeat-containing protein n=1 Tax=Candidatus Gallacutalibacter pullicola TaxID=2840830 RepID=A0A9D1DSN0_9FIRM|nr:right-handed parallel beta-helix repeat-containing protein [Candidatus Gallacutalibacter pullicola]